MVYDFVDSCSLSIIGLLSGTSILYISLRVYRNMGYIIDITRMAF